MFLTIPTLLTWARIAAIPLIIGVYYLGWDMASKNLVATALFVLFAATDWLDGYLARKLNLPRNRKCARRDCRWMSGSAFPHPTIV